MNQLTVKVDHLYKHCVWVMRGASVYFLLMMMMRMMIKINVNNNHGSIENLKTMDLAGEGGGMINCPPKCILRSHNRRMSKIVLVASL